MVLNVADFYFEVGEVRSAYAKALCADYICEDPPRIDADVRLTQADLDAEAEAARRFFTAADARRTSRGRRSIGRSAALYWRTMPF